MALRADSDVYCPACNKVCGTLKQFIFHALDRHGRIYHSRPKGDNYQIAL
jgi:hypothetical protein